ncbi:four-helix bundle copper-binding protein [Petroclostridium sp. X23]|uniref:four-helix bundle copper-binding protein n=1 Tax=Petroclostridium sp. X23 TaxID=3045146 RepID=UPI0024AE7F8B|nr:four-helix bundle copper-binding protein [Petroclostridium sp. X23]WHH59986.1 four-helix bundle copper-binding protein [Petroclostridium sp. X23]
MGVVTNTTDKYQACIDACNKCFQACFECLKACLNEPDAAARKACIGILLECAKICELSSAYMAMDAQYAKDLCKLCAAICDKCATECDMFKDDHCQKCANVCRTCADECRKMAGA